MCSGSPAWTHQCHHQQTSFQTPSCNWNRPLLWLAESSKRRFCVLSFGECWSPSSRLRQSSIINDAASNLCIPPMFAILPYKNKSSRDINRLEKWGWNRDNQGARDTRCAQWCCSWFAGQSDHPPPKPVDPLWSFEVWIRSGWCTDHRHGRWIFLILAPFFWLISPQFFVFLSSQVVSRDVQSMMVWWTTFFGADLATIFTQSWSCDVQACISILESWAEGSSKGFQLHRTLGMWWKVLAM